MKALTRTLALLGCAAALGAALAACDQELGNGKERFANSGGFILPDAVVASYNLDGTEDELEIIGSGAYVDDNTFGTSKVFKNIIDDAGEGTNYLKLPENLFEETGVTNTKAMTIGFWVKKNKDAEIINWSPLFTAQPKDATWGVFNWPYFAVEVRIDIGWNIEGYYDPANGAYNDITWISENDDWHYVTVTVDGNKTNSIVYYIDGIEKFTLKDSDSPDGTIAGIFDDVMTNMATVALGGLQACGWKDPDLSASFAKFTVWNVALTGPQVKAMYDVR